MLFYPGQDAAVIDRPGASSGSPRDITSELVAVLADNQTALIMGGPNGAEGYYTIDVDTIGVTTAMRARNIIGAGGRTTNVNIIINGTGVGIDFEALGCRIQGLKFLDPANGKLGVGVKAHTGRYFTADDISCFGLSAGIEINGLAYFWRVSDSYFSQCTGGLSLTEDTGEGPNRGVVSNCLVENCTVGYDNQGANTVEYINCRSQANATGLKVQANRGLWIGGSFENDTVNAIEVVSGSSDNVFNSFNITDADPISDSGTRSTWTNVNGGTYDPFA